MKTPLFLLLSLALLAGCKTPHKWEQGYSSSGFFTLNGGTNTVFWMTLNDSVHTDIQFVILLPATNVVGRGGQTGYSGYQNWQMEMIGNGHQCFLAAIRNFKSGSQSLRFSDVTANSVADVNLGQSRFWRLSEAGVLIPLDKLDPEISEKLTHESENVTSIAAASERRRAAAIAIGASRGPGR